MIYIRPEFPNDADSIYSVNERAFGQILEATIVNKLRGRNSLVISLVAIEEINIVGHIAFSQVTIESEYSKFEAIALAPMAVLPEYQRRGIGSQLVRAGLEECCHLRYYIVLVLGHPNYYPRFGFSSAKLKGIKCEFDVPDEAWMILELKEGALRGRGGTVKFQPEFHDVD